MAALASLALAGGCAQGIDHADPSQTVWVTAKGAMPVTFAMGTDDTCPGESCTLDRRPRQVTVSPFQIDTTEVSLVQFSVWAAHKGVALPAWDYDRRNRPVAVFDVATARAYCADQKSADGQPGRLPTEAEWELAARWGGGGTLYRFPWGDDVMRLQQCQVPSLQCRADTSDVGTNAADENPVLGIYDMASNLPEWVDDDYTPAPGCLAETPFAALCPMASCITAVACAGACVTGCAPGILGVSVGTAYFCIAGSGAKMDPLMRTATPDPMYKGGGAALDACLAEPAMRKAINQQTTLRPAVGFRCAYGPAVKPTPTARLLINPPAGATQLRMSVANTSLAAGAWHAVGVTVFDAQHGATSLPHDAATDDVVVDFMEPLPTPLVLALEGAPPIDFKLLMDFAQPAGHCTLVHTVALSMGEPALGGVDHVGETCQ
jgi:formylglycine-generating enzyme required for sulfatase activity